MTSPRWAAAILAVPALLGLTALTAAPAEAGPAYPSYVALGDSYAAGPLVPLPAGRPVGCLRSDHDYPSVVARTLGVATLTDVSCSRATIDNLASPQPVVFGSNPPQLDALRPDTALVTLTIGGNDIGFLSIVEKCATLSITKPFGAACRDSYTAGGVDQLAARITAIGPKIAAALGAITARSPRALVALVGYPAVLPDTGPGCFPLVPYTAGDVAYLRDTEKRLNAMLAARAAAAGATFVDTYTPSIGHDVCQPPGPKWIEGLIPTSPAAPVHPNAQGEAGMAAAVVAAVGSTGRQA